MSEPDLAAAVDIPTTAMMRALDNGPDAAAPRNNAGGPCTGTVNECRVCEGIDCPPLDATATNNERNYARTNLGRFHALD